MRKEGRTEGRTEDEERKRKEGGIIDARREGRLEGILMNGWMDER